VPVHWPKPPELIAYGWLALFLLLSPPPYCCCSPLWQAAP
jgi:hypothetical protein